MSTVLSNNNNVANIATEQGYKRDLHHQYRKQSYSCVTLQETNFYINSRYQVQKVLGQGSYGTVCSAIDSHSKNNHASIAIKKVSPVFKKDVLLKRAVREMKLMRFFRGHRNIIGLIDLDLVYFEPFDGLYCFQELCNFDLARVIQSGTLFSEFHIQSFLYQILCGLKYIHSAEVIHRDLKPNNILVTQQGTLKICDFGLARGIAEQYMRTRSHAITNYVATRWYRAPELLFSTHSYSKAIDLWAVGCILAELYGRKPLFPGRDHLDQAHRIIKVLGTPSSRLVRRYTSEITWLVFGPPNKIHRAMPWPQVYPYASHDALHLLSRLLCWDPSERYNVTDAIGHPFLRNVREPSDEPICPDVFDFSFESKAKNLNDYKILLHDEVESFKREKLGSLRN